MRCKPELPSHPEQIGRYAAFARLWCGRWSPTPPALAEPPPRAVCCRSSCPPWSWAWPAALVLLGVSSLAEQLQDVLWEALPDALGIGGYSVLWMIVMLTATGIAVGLVVWKVPGHAGPDPATTGLVEPPLPPDVLPGLLVVTVLTLAGGVEPGAREPDHRRQCRARLLAGPPDRPATPAALWMRLAAAGTIGALFGTPVAAALILSEALAAEQRRAGRTLGPAVRARSRPAPRGRSPCRCWPTPASTCHCRRTPARTGAICSPSVVDHVGRGAARTGGGVRLPVRPRALSHACGTRC